MKPRLVWREMSVAKGDRARIFLNGKEAPRVIACGPFWIKQHIKFGDRYAISDDGTRIHTQIRIGIVRWLPVECS